MNGQADTAAAQGAVMTRPLIYDTTLTQRQAEMNPEDRIKLAERLKNFGLDMIEGGWPTVYPLDRIFFKRVQAELTDDVRAALVAMAPVPAAADSEKVVAELLASGTGHVGLALAAVGAEGVWASEQHVEQAATTIAALVAGLEGGAGRHVIVHVHNAFDAWRRDREHVATMLRSLVAAGAGVVVLVDSGGGATPWEVDETVQALRGSHRDVLGDALLGVGCRDDSETAVASTLFAARSGAQVLSGCVNGFDLAVDLCTIIPALQLKMHAPMVSRETLAGLTTLSRAVDEQGNSPHRNNQPFVGQSAFAHKGGIHVAAVLKNEDSYQHIDPGIVGNERRILISELSGRGNIMSKVEELGMLGQKGGADSEGGGAKPPEWKERSAAILRTVKDLEQKGYTFEGADASVDLMIRRSDPGYKPPFEVVEYQVNNHDREPTAERTRRWTSGIAGDYTSKDRKQASCKAVVAVRFDEELMCLRREESCSLEDDNTVLEVSSGNGPIDALAKALNRALLPSFASLTNVELTDYKVRILDADHATAANVRVMIEFHDKSRSPRAGPGPGDVSKPRWTTVSAGTNIIAASMSALVDGYEYHLASEVAAIREKLRAEKFP